MTTSAKPLVVLSGNTVTTWDSLNENDVFAICPQGDLPLADVAWNHNGQVLATCSAVSTDDHLHNNVVLTAVQSGNLLDSLQHNQQWNRPAGATTSLAFGGKSRYLCIGDKSGAVCLWDLKKKVRVRQFFHDGQASQQVSLDPTDTYMLSLTAQAFRSYKLREGIAAGTWTTPPESDFSFTTYNTSTLEPNIAAVGTNDGSLLLYDITNAQTTVPFYGLYRRHAGPITGVGFSYTNDKLVASSSADGTLQFFDKSSGNLIEQLAQLSSGITSLTLNVDGISCAVGTKGGQVLLYDLRRAGTALASLYVQGPVKCVRFSPPPKQKGNVPTTKTTVSTPATLSKQQATDNGSGIKQQSMDHARRDLDHQATTKTNLYQTASTTLQSSKTSSFFFSPQQQLQQQPLQQQPSTLSEDPQTSYIGPMMDHQQQNNGKMEMSGQPSNPASPLKSHTVPQHSTSESTSSYGGGGGPGLPVQPSPYGSPSSSPREHAHTTENHPQSPSRTRAPLSSNRGNERNNNPAGGAGSSSATVLNVEEIRDVVRDEVEKLQDDLEETLRNLHMDMIRQFHQQSQELNNALSSQLAAMDQLREENQRLREENDFLKRHHHKQQQNESPTGPQSSGQRKHFGGNSMIFGN